MTGKTRHEISVDIRIFFTVYVMWYARRRTVRWSACVSRWTRSTPTRHCWRRSTTTTSSERWKNACHCVPLQGRPGTSRLPRSRAGNPCKDHHSRAAPPTLPTNMPAERLVHCLHDASSRRFLTLKTAHMVLDPVQQTLFVEEFARP